MEKLKVKRFNELAILPTRAHHNDAGLDLYSPVDVNIYYGGYVKINLHIGFELPEGTVGLLFDRSSLGAIGLRMLGGVVDAGYRGEVHVTLAKVAAEMNGGAFIPDYTAPYKIKRGDKIAQLLIVPILTPEVEEVAELEETIRGSKGFGSSGR